MSNPTFGAPTTTTANTIFGFGAAKPATATGFGPPASTIPPSTGLFATPATTTVQPAPSFGMIPASTGNVSFLTATTSAPAFGASPAGTGLFSSLAPTTTPSGLSFATPVNTGTSFLAATTSAPSFATPAPATTGALPFGTTASMPTLSFGTTATSAASIAAPSFGVTTTSAPPPFGFAAKPTTTAVTTSTSKGLGGTDVSFGTKGLSQGSSNPAVAKENHLPNELMQTIENFKDCAKSQKTLSSDIARGSARTLNRCAEDMTSLMKLLTTLAGSVQRDRALADKLKQDTAKALQNAEIAQRTHNTPPGLQYENNAPLLFFMELTENFEQDLMLFRSQIETMEKHIETMMTPKTLTPQELTMTMNKLHESFVALAGKLQSVHQNVQQKKEQYLNFRKYVLKDSSNVFEDLKAGGKDLGKTAFAPAPLDAATKSFLSSSTGQAQVNYTPQNSSVWGNVTSVPSATTLSLSNSMKPPTASLNFNPPVNLTAPLPTADISLSFQLQKPPIGNKRGKH